MSIIIPIKYFDLCHFEAKIFYFQLSKPIIPFKNILKKIFQFFSKKSTLYVYNKLLEGIVDFRGNNWKFSVVVLKNFVNPCNDWKIINTKINVFHIGMTNVSLNCQCHFMFNEFSDLEHKK